MPGTARPAISTRHGPGWLNLFWKVALALSILVLMSAGIPVPLGLFFTWIWATLLVWGGLVVLVAASNLFEDLQGLRWTWAALSLGAYAALSVPAVAAEDPARLVEALGPVAALALAAHLGRRDLARALRDWALVVALALYAALGVLAMARIVLGFGLLFFIVAALLPPLVTEVLFALMRRVAAAGSLVAQLASTIVATGLAIAVFSFTLLNRSTPLAASLVFDVVAGLVIGGALFISLLTRPLVEAASGAHAGASGAGVGRALVEVSHAPMLISLSLYVFSRLLGMAQ